MRAPVRASLIIAVIALGVPLIALVVQTMLGQGPLRSDASVRGSDETTIFATQVVLGGGGGDTTAPSAPGQPMPNTLDSTTNPSITWTWTAATDNVGVTDYQITIGSSAGASNVAEAVSTSNATSYTRSSLSDGTYFVKVRARDAAGNTGAYSANSPGVQVDATAPTLSAVSASASGTSITVTWTTNEASTSRLSSELNVTLPAENTNLTTSHTVTVTGLTAGQAYTFNAQSTDAIGNTGTSNPVSATVPAAASSSSSTSSSSSSSSSSSQQSSTTTQSSSSTNESSSSTTTSAPTSTTVKPAVSSSASTPATPATSAEAPKPPTTTDDEVVTIQPIGEVIVLAIEPTLTPWQEFAIAYSLIGALLAALASVLHWLLPYLANRPAEGVNEAIAQRVHRIQAIAAGFGWLEYPLIAFGSIVEWSLVATQLDGVAKHQTLLALYAALWCLQILLWLKRPLTGRVVTPRQAPIPLAIVRALPAGTSHVYATVTTNRNGWFRIPAHPSRYELQIGKEGYSPTSGTETVDTTHGARAMFSLTPGRPEPTLTKPNPAGRASFWDIAAKHPAKLVEKR